MIIPVKQQICRIIWGKSIFRPADRNKPLKRGLKNAREECRANQGEADLISKLINNKNTKPGGQTFLFVHIAVIPAQNARQECRAY